MYPFPFHRHGGTICHKIHPYIPSIYMLYWWSVIDIPLSTSLSGFVDSNNATAEASTVNQLPLPAVVLQGQRRPDETEAMFSFIVKEEQTIHGSKTVW